MAKIIERKTENTFFKTERFLASFTNTIYRPRFIHIYAMRLLINDLEQKVSTRIGNQDPINTKTRSE